MSEDRKIDALAPRTRRQGIASSLKASDRDAETRMEIVPSPNTERSESVKAGKNTALRRRPGSSKVQIAVDIPEDLRGRARSAFRHAQFFEGVASFSEFVANALEAETRRVEIQHNDGQRFSPDTENLPSGRPLRS